MNTMFRMMDYQAGNIGAWGKGTLARTRLIVHMIFAQGFKDSDSALLEQGKSAVKEYLQGQILLLEDAKDMTENIRNILEDMLIMIEEY